MINRSEATPQRGLTCHVITPALGMSAPRKWKMRRMPRRVFLQTTLEDKESTRRQFNPRSAVSSSNPIFYSLFFICGCAADDSSLDSTSIAYPLLFEISSHRPRLDERLRERLTDRDESHSTPEDLHVFPTNHFGLSILSSSLGLEDATDTVTLNISTPKRLDGV